MFLRLDNFKWLDFKFSDFWLWLLKYDVEILSEFIADIVIFSLELVLSLYIICISLEVYTVWGISFPWITQFLSMISFSILNILKPVELKALMNNCYDLIPHRYFLLIFFCEWVIFSCFFASFLNLLWETGHFECYNKITLEIISFFILRACFAWFLWVLVICLELFYLFL